MTTLSAIITPTNLVTATDTQTLTNKTIAYGSNTLTDVVGVSATQTLTNKTLTAPTIASANLTTALTLAGAAGTNGQVLTSAGSGLPTWSSPSAGSLTLLSTVTASNSATVDVETTFSSTYDAYLLVVTGMTSQNNNVGIRAQMKLSGSYVSTSTYKYFVDSSQSNFGAGNSNSNSSTEIILSNGSTGNNAADSADLQISIYNPSNTAFSKMITWDGVNYITSLNTGTVGTASGIAVNTGTGALTGLRIYFGSGNVVAGKFRLYGIANS